MDLLPFLLASADVAAQAAGAPVAASLAREITQSCEDVAKHKVSMIFSSVSFFDPTGNVETCENAGR